MALEHDNLETEVTGYNPPTQADLKRFLRLDAYAAALGATMAGTGEYLLRKPQQSFETKIVGRFLKWTGVGLTGLATADAAWNTTRLAANWIEEAYQTEDQAHFEYMMRDTQ